ncbi:MAG: putrescine-ornithine antiporter [Psittacicella sp.]
MVAVAEKRKMGIVSLTVFVAVNMMGSGIILLPADMASLGGISLLSWVVTTIGALLIAYSFSKAGKYCKKDGGMSAYAQSAHGKSAFFISSYAYYICLIISAVAIAVTLISYLAVFVHWLQAPIHQFIGVVIALIITTFINFISPKATGRISQFTIWGVIIPVVASSLIGWFWFKPHLFATAWNPHHITFGAGISSGIAITLWAFLGIETAGAVSNSVKNPEKNVPIAVMAATIFCAIFYLGSTAVAQGIVPNKILAASQAPLGLIFSYMLGHTVGSIIAILSVIACLGSLLAWQFTNAMVGKAAADDKLFPQIFGLSSDRGIPIIGMIIMLILELIIAALSISKNSLETFNILLNMSVFLNLIPYIYSISGTSSLLARRGSSRREYITTVICSSGAVIYSLYAVYACGQSAVFWGAIIALFGYLCYGYIASRQIKNQIAKGELVEKY